MEEAIGALKKNLGEKEMQIGGIYESSWVFHHHFILVYESVEIRIKWSYYSNYGRHNLNIHCFEFKETPHNKNKLYDNYYQTLNMKVQ